MYEQYITGAPDASNILMAANALYGQDNLAWTVEPVTGSTPQPQYDGSVTSNTSGRERIERALVNNTNGAASVVSQSGSWLTFNSCSGSGICSFTITSGIFSSAPSCFCSALNVGANVCNVVNVSTTNITVRSMNSTFTPSNENNVPILCMGPR